MKNARIVFYHNVVNYVIRIKKEDYVTYPLCVFQYIYSTAISKNVSHALFNDYSISFHDNVRLLLTLLPKKEIFQLNYSLIITHFIVNGCLKQRFMDIIQET